MTTTERPSDQLSRQDIANLLGVRVETIGVHRRRGAIPEPDGYTARSPWWFRKTINRWMRDRPAAGWNPATHDHLRHTHGGTNGTTPARPAKRQPRPLAASNNGTREAAGSGARKRRG